MEESTDNPVWDVIRSGDTPDQLVLDPETGLENVLALCGCLPVIAAFGLGLSFLGDGPESGALSVFLGLLALGTFFIVLRCNLDDHYILHFGDKEILFHRKFFGRIKKRRLCAFSDLHSLVVEPERNSNKNSTWWEYGLLAVTRAGRKIRVVSPDDQDYEKVSTHGAQVAQLLDIPFYSGEPRTILKISMGPEGPQVEYRPYSNASIIAVILGVFVVAALVVAVASAL